MAINLAVAVRHHGTRSLLVDAHPHKGDATEMLRLGDGPSLGDVLALRRALPDVLRPGPAGIQVVPGVCGVERLSDYPAGVTGLFARQLHGLAGKIDLAIADAGIAATPLATSMIDVADLVVIVTTDAQASIMDTYEAMRGVCRQTATTAVLALINRAGCGEEAGDRARRLRTACRRFLGFDLTVLGPVPDYHRIAKLTTRGQPIVLAEPSGTPAHTLVDAGRNLIDSPRIRRPVGQPDVQILGPFRARD